MKAIKVAAVVLVLAFATAQLQASGLLGIYAIVEKVVFEPDEKAPARLQVWGAFAYVDGGVTRPESTSGAKRGYLYFTLPESNQAGMEAVKKEWADLKAVAGTGQAVAFGNYLYIGNFAGLQPDGVNTSPPRDTPPYTLRPIQNGGAQADLRVRPQSEAPANPVVYSTNAGILKLTAQGSHAATVSELNRALSR